MTEHGLDKKATPREAKRLAREGHLSPEALEHVLGLLGEVPSRQRWAQFIQTLFLGIGWVMIVVGVFFFFGFNWDKIPVFVQFAIVEVLLIAAFLMASLKGLDSQIGHVALIVGSCMVGLLVALIGQTYQLNADTSFIFLLWSLLIAGWVVASRYYLHVVFFAILINVTLFTFIDEVVIDYRNEWVLSMLALLLLNGFLLVLWEVGMQRAWPWAAKGWVVRIIFFTVLTVGTLPAISFLSGESNQSTFFLIEFVVFVAVLGIAFYYYRFRKLDKFMLAMTFLSLLSLAIAWMINILGTEWWDFLITGIVVVILSTLSTRWLQGIPGHMEGSK